MLILLIQDFAEKKSKMVCWRCLFHLLPWLSLSLQHQLLPMRLLLPWLNMSHQHQQVLTRHLLPWSSALLQRPSRPARRRLLWRRALLQCQPRPTRRRLQWTRMLLQRRVICSAHSCGRFRCSRARHVPRSVGFIDHSHVFKTHGAAVLRSARIIQSCINRRAHEAAT